MRKLKYCLLLVSMFILNVVLSQSLDTVQFTYVSKFLYEAFLPYSTYSAKFDDQQRPYLYTANVAARLS